MSRTRRNRSGQATRRGLENGGALPVSGGLGIWRSASTNTQAGIRTVGGEVSHGNCQEGRSVTDQYRTLHTTHTNTHVKRRMQPALRTTHQKPKKGCTHNTVVVVVIGGLGGGGTLVHISSVSLLGN